MKFKFLKAAFVGTILTISSLSHAALINFTGELASISDFTITEFTVNTDSQVRGWTDSFRSGVGFDPIVALWSSDGSWLLTVDDNSSINPATQTYYDSGFSRELSAGTYFFTMSIFSNFPDQSGNVLISNPFTGSGGPLMDGQYSVWLDGVDTAQTTTSEAVPEPSTLAILALGMIGLASRRFKKQS